MKKSGALPRKNHLAAGIVLTAVSVIILSVSVTMRPATRPPFFTSYMESVPRGKLPATGFSGLLMATVTEKPLPQVTIERMFPGDGQPDADVPGMVTLIATGDVMTARSVNLQAVTRDDFRWAFEKVADAVRAADMTLINLETPLLTDCPPTDKGMVFCGDARHIRGLLDIGTDVASLANNHAGNYGSAGIRETEAHLREAGIAVAGTGQPVYLVRNATTYAFLAYNDIGSRVPGIDWAADNDVAAGIRNAAGNADAVIVSFHWGNEYVRMPNARQRHLAHLAVDSGADLVVGNHPHWYQPAEVYRGKVIVYAHGNSVFDQMWSKETMTGVIGRYGFVGGTLVSVRFIPVGIRDFGQVYFLEGADRDAVISVMKQTSLDLSQVPFTE